MPSGDNFFYLDQPWNCTMYGEFIGRDLVEHSCFGPDLREAINSDRNPQILVEQLVKERAEFPEIYMACGDQDSLLDSNRKFSALLEHYHVSHTFEVGSGSHEWDFWDTYIKRVLEWLPLEGKEESRSSGNHYHFTAERAFAIL